MISSRQIKFKMLAVGLLSGIAVSIVLPILPIAKTPPAKAQFGEAVFVVNPVVRVFETNPTIISSETITAAQTGAETTQTLFEWAQSFVLSTLKKRLLDMIVDQIVVWVQGGGEPKFVTDWQGFLADFGNVAAGDFVEELGLGFLCSPFNFQIQLLLAPVPRFSQQVTCTLDQIVGNIENFYQDFRNGGWIAYSTAWQPQNNFFGAYILSTLERDRRVGEAQFAAWSEAIAGGGYLGVRSEDGQIATPGSAVGAAVAKAIGSDIDFIVNAEQLQDYVAAIADAFINRMIISGVNGLKGMSTPSAPSGGAIPPTARGPCAGLSGATFAGCQQYNQTFGNSMAAARQHMASQIDVELNPLLNSQNVIDQTTALENQTIEKLGQLKKCHESKAETSKAEQVQNRVNTEQAHLANSEAIGDNNLSRIATLQTSRVTFTSLADGDWVGLSSAIANLGPINPTSAVNFETAVAAQRDAAQERLSQAQTDLNQCQ